MAAKVEIPMDLFGSAAFAGDVGEGFFPEEPTEDVAPQDIPIEHNDIRNTPVEPPTPPKHKPKQLESQLAGMYTMAGLGVFSFDQQLGAVIMSKSDECAKALSDVADKNPAVKKALNNMLATSAWGAVISAHLPIVVLAATKYVPQLNERYGETVSAFIGTPDVSGTF